MTKNIKLNSGYEIPNLGLGTWRARPGDVKIAVKNALDLNYRHIDCAWIYGNENEIGEVLEADLKSGKVKREDLFITSKLWNSFHRPELVPKGLAETLDNLKLDYLDLYLMHWPMALKPGNRVPSEEVFKNEIDEVPILETWKAMEKLVDSGKVRSIGVSNFNIKQVQNILDHCRIKPAMNQVEIHIQFPNTKLVDFCLKNNIQVTAYSPLGGTFERPNGVVKPLEDPEVLKIAKKLNAKPGQVMISYILHRGLICIPKSVSPARLEDNLKGAAVKLSEEDFKILHNRNVNTRMSTMEVFKLDKNYPFSED